MTNTGLYKIIQSFKIDDFILQAKDVVYLCMLDIQVIFQFIETFVNNTFSCQ